MTEPTPPEQYQVVDRNTTGPRAVFVNLDAIRLREVEAERDLLLAQNTTLRAEVERITQNSQIAISMLATERDALNAALSDLVNYINRGDYRSNAIDEIRVRAMKLLA